MDYTEISKKADEEFASGKIEEAIGLLEKGLDIAREKGHESYIEFFLGELDNVKGDYESALHHHKQAVKLNPDNPFLLKNLGVTYSLGRTRSCKIQYCTGKEKPYESCSSF